MVSTVEDLSLHSTNGDMSPKVTLTFAFCFKHFESCCMLTYHMVLIPIKILKINLINVNPIILVGLFLSNLDDSTQRPMSHEQHCFLFKGLESLAVPCTLVLVEVNIYI